MINNESTFSEVKSELLKRYLYLYNNKKLILSLCIGKRKDKEELGKYYLLRDIDDNVVNTFFDFLFSDNDMENSVLYNQIELIKSNSEYLYMYNYLITMVEKSRGSIFTVWKILSYVREKCKNNDVFLKALDKYYNIDRYVISGRDYNSGYRLLKIDAEMMTNDDYKRYPSSDMVVIDFNEYVFEMVDEYFVCEYDTDIYDKSNKGYSSSNFMSSLVNGSMLDIENKRKILENINKNRIKQRIK